MKSLAEYERSYEIRRAGASERTTKFIRVICKGVKYRARKRFLAGKYANPYNFYSENLLDKGMADLFEDEMEKLKSENLCPCCGLTTHGNRDW